MKSARSLMLGVLTVCLSLLLLACPTSSGTPNPSVEAVLEGNVVNGLCLPEGIGVSSPDLATAIRAAGFAISPEAELHLAQFDGCGPDLAELLRNQEVVAVDSDGLPLAQSPIDKDGDFSISLPLSADTLFGVLLAERDETNHLLCLQALEYQVLDEKQATLETFPALFGFDATARQVDLGSFRLNEQSARFAADLGLAPAGRLDTDDPNFVSGLYLDCQNSTALQTPVNALFRFELPPEAEAQAIDVTDFALLLALRLGDDGRYSFVNAGTLDSEGRLDLSLISSPDEDFSRLRFFLADSGFFDERKLDFPPTPFVDTALFGFQPQAQALPVNDAIQLGTINAAFAFMEAHVETKEGIPVPNSNVLGLIQQDERLSLNFTRSDAEGLWQMFIPPGADYSFIAFDDSNTILGGRTISIDEARRFGPSDANITVNALPEITGFSASMQQGLAVDFNISVTDADGEELTCTLDYGDDSVEVIEVCATELRNHVYRTAGSYQAKLTVTDGLNTVSSTLELEVGASVSDFELALSPESLSFAQGEEEFVVLTISRSNFPDEISFRATQVPNDLEVSFSPAATTGDDTLIRLDASNSLAPGSYQLGIQGLSGGRIRTVMLGLEIEAGQSCEGNFVIDELETAGDLAALSTCSEIFGSLTISNTELSSLEALSQLRRIRGDLILMNNQWLTDLEGLASLERIEGGLRIDDNTSLRSLEAISVDTLSFIDIRNNAALTELGFQQAVEVENGINLEGNPSLTTLDGLEGTTRIRSNVAIRHNEALTDLSGLMNLETVEGNLSFDNNASLASLDALSNLSTVDGWLFIVDNPRLGTLDGLENIEQVWRLSVDNNENLLSLRGLHNLGEVTEFISIFDNRILSDLNALSNLDKVTSIRLISNPALTGLNGLQEVDSLEELLILDNNALTTLLGLNGLRSATMVTVQNNENLTTLDGLQQLTSIEADLELFGNPALTDIQALENLRSVEGQAKISGNTALNCAQFELPFFPVDQSVGNLVDCPVGN